MLHVSMLVLHPLLATLTTDAYPRCNPSEFGYACLIPDPLLPVYVAVGDFLRSLHY